RSGAAMAGRACGHEPAPLCETSGHDADLCDPPALLFADERNENRAALRNRSAPGPRDPPQPAECALGPAAAHACHAGLYGDGLLILEEATQRSCGLP